MGHYDEKPKKTISCEDCGREITIRYSSSTTRCNDCKESYRTPEYVSTDVTIECDREEGEVRATVTISNSAPVNQRMDVQRATEYEYKYGIVGYVRFESGDSVAEMPWIRTSHMMDWGEIGIRENGTNGMTFTWIDGGVEQEQTPTVKYEGEVGQDFLEDTTTVRGGPFDGESVSVEFHPSNTDMMDSVTAEQTYPNYLIDL